MDENKHKTIKKYFAAANSYRGFINYFDKVFPSEDFKRIYVLKGGPGTGKSSLMKKFSKALYDIECDVEEIYCSSDPSSLDGVIASRNGNKIAFIDGTAPHERDAIIPGAVDEIINLGNNWDKKWLIAKRDDIIALCKEKSESYKTAYQYLQIAGQAAKQIKFVYLSKFNELKAKTKAETFLPKLCLNSTGKIQTRLKSSFGRYGEFNLEIQESSDKKIIGVGGNDNSISLFLEVCLSRLMQISADITVFPSALDPDSLDAIELHNEELLILKKQNCEIDADEFVLLTEVDKERIKTSEAIRKDALNEAKRWFKIASDIHFRLEGIYSQAMNFEKNDRIFEEKTTELKNIL